MKRITFAFIILTFLVIGIGIGFYFGLSSELIDCGYKCSLYIKSQDLFLLNSSIIPIIP